MYRNIFKIGVVKGFVQKNKRLTDIKKYIIARLDIKV
jgi:hypothetical protein